MPASLQGGDDEERRVEIAVSDATLGLTEKSCQDKLQSGDDVRLPVTE